MKKTSSIDELQLLPEVDVKMFALDKCYSKIKSGQAFVNIGDDGENIFHELALCLDLDLNNEELMRECFELISSKHNYERAIEFKDFFGNTSIDYAIKYNNICFLKILLEFTEIDLFPKVENKTVSIEIATLLIQKSFGVTILDQLKDEMIDILIDKMAKKHVGLVLGLLKTFNIVLEDKKEEHFAKKVMNYNDQGLLYITAISGVGIKYILEVPDNNIGIMAIAIQKDDLDTASICLNSTSGFSLTNYYKLISEVNIVCQYWDAEGDTIFQKLVNIPKENREDNFNLLMYLTVGKILEYLNKHEDNKDITLKIKPMNIIHLKNNSGKSALEKAVEFDQIDFVEALIKLNAIDMQMFEGLKITGSKKMSKLLHNQVLNELGIKQYVEQLKDEKLEIVMHAASCLIEHAGLTSLGYITKLLKSAEISLDFQSFSHKLERKTSAAANSLLHKAIVFQRLDVVTDLIKFGVNMNLQNKEGFSPLMIAVSLDNYTLVKTLLENKADVNLRSVDGNSPIYFAVNGKHCIVQLLLQYGAKLDVDNKFNLKPLDYLSIESTGLVELIFEIGSEKIRLYHKENNKLDKTVKLVNRACQIISCLEVSDNFLFVHEDVMGKVLEVLLKDEKEYSEEKAKELFKFLTNECFSVGIINELFSKYDFFDDQISVSNQKNTNYFSEDSEDEFENVRINGENHDEDL